MSKKSELLTPCTYVKLSGEVCGKMGYRSVCGQHVKSCKHITCIVCHRVTRSQSGYCGAHSCVVAKNCVKRMNANKEKYERMQGMVYSSHWRKRDAAATATVAATAIFANELDQYVEDLVAGFTPGAEFEAARV